MTKAKKPIETVEGEIIPVKVKRGKSRLNFTKEDEKNMFKDLAHMTTLEVAIKYGVDKIYESPTVQKLQVSNIFRKVKAAADLYDISPEAVEIVDSAVVARRFENNPTGIMVKEREAIEFKDKLDVIRDSATQALQKKLDKINRNTRGVDSVKIKELSDVISMSIDKSRLLSGESTENVLHHARIDTKNITPEQAIELLLKGREAMMERRDK